jgi:hypothetical protein
MNHAPKAFAMYQSAEGVAMYQSAEGAARR